MLSLWVAESSKQHPQRTAFLRPGSTPIIIEFANEHSFIIFYICRLNYGTIYQQRVYLWNTSTHLKAVMFQTRLIQRQKRCHCSLRFTIVLSFFLITFGSSCIPAPTISQLAVHPGFYHIFQSPCPPILHASCPLLWFQAPDTVTALTCWPHCYSLVQPHIYIRSGISQKHNNISGMQPHLLPPFSTIFNSVLSHSHRHQITPDKVLCSKPIPDWGNVLCPNKSSTSCVHLLHSREAVATTRVHTNMYGIRYKRIAFQCRTSFVRQYLMRPQKGFTMHWLPCYRNTFQSCSASPPHALQSILSATTFVSLLVSPRIGPAHTHIHTSTSYLSVLKQAVPALGALSNILQKIYGLPLDSYYAFWSSLLKYRCHSLLLPFMLC